MSQKGKNQPKINPSIFQQMSRKALHECCKILGVNTARLIKGAIVCELPSLELRFRIRRYLSSNTSSDRIERLEDFLDTYTPSQADTMPCETEKKAHRKVNQLIQKVRTSFEGLSKLQKLEILADWIQHPDDCDDWETIDYLAQYLGFRYEETEDEDEERVLIYPSPDRLAAIITDLSDSNFYHYVIALAGLALPRDQFSPPPSLPPYATEVGYDFLEEIAQYFTSIAKLA